ncbi:SNARE-binding exocyst subunit S6 [Kappamyces sp. JEL0680]|nr:SNARE-binding exocyst subunit S6 [Kappamyces sp. JEL0680]
MSSEMVDILRGRSVKGYRIKFFDYIRDQINSEIKRMYLDKEKELSSVLGAFDEIVDTLTFVHDELTPLFPRRYNIFHFYVLEYHRSIYNTVNLMTEGDMEPASILTLIKWVRDYYSSMSDRLDVSEDLLEPKLLDGREEEFMEVYVTLVRGKLTEWLRNILNSETLDFLQRNCPPEMDTTGQYLLTGSVIAFQMFNQQLDLVSTASRGHLLSEVVAECCNVMQEFQNAWIKLVDLEYNKFFQKSNDLNEGLVEYIIALANDCMRSTEFSDTISARLETMSDESYKQANLDRVKSVLEGFMKIQKRCVQVIIDIIMSDLKPALEVMHCSQWYEQDVMRLIVGTFEDYGNDCQKHMAEYVYNKMMTELVDRFIVAYIETFKNKNAKFKMPSAPERMRTDVEMVVGFFSRSKSAKRAKAAFEVIEKIVGLIESNPRMLYMDFYSLWNQFPDMPLDFVEKVLGKRDDLDKSTAREIIDQCKAKASELARDAPPSVFSKISK